MSPRKPDEPVRLTRIYTRGGDRGETSLGDGSRVSKLDPLLRAYGAVDELNSVVGWAQVEAADEPLARIQNELFDLGADLSVPFAEDDERLRITQAAVERLEQDCDEANAAAGRAARASCSRAVVRRPPACTSRARFAAASSARCSPSPPSATSTRSRSST